MTINRYENNELGQNTYLYYDPASGEGVLIDAGCGAADMEAVLTAARENNVIIRAILLTHGHYDHIAAVDALRGRLPASVDVCGHADETQITENPNLNGSYFFSKALRVTPDRLLRDGDVFTFGGCALKTLHTPGHTPGGVCYYDEARGNLFTGDVLFRESIGRTDFPRGNRADLLRGIAGKILALPDGTAIYPGHGPATSVGHERRHNPFVGDGIR
jgi:glyoxylase-like metal-dependent hydrolase (beta-lactamase superfamily II)